MNQRVGLKNIIHSYAQNDHCEKIISQAITMMKNYNGRKDFKESDKFKKDK